ncbi:Histone-lysine N-methyltransferase, H3 lysine-36 specific, partial [Frankliniella fusca]
LGDAPRPREVKVSRSPDFSARSHQAYGALQCDVAAAAVTSVVCAAICLWRSESDHFLATIEMHLSCHKDQPCPLKMGNIEGRWSTTNTFGYSELTLNM